MAGKFQIFCDEPSNQRSTFEPGDKPMGQHPQLAPQRHPSASQQPTSLQPSKLHIDNQSQGLSAGLASSNNHASNTSKPNSQSQGNDQEKGIVYKVLQPLKREPLGLRQPLSQASNPATSTAATTVAHNLASSSDALNSSTSSALSINEENQENDISMASLGSDFIPSIIHDDDENNHDDEEEEDYDFSEQSSIVSEFSNHHDTSLQNNSCALIDDISLMDDLAVSEDDDEEVTQELAKAFRKHDEAELFKSTIYIEDIKSYLGVLERDIELRPLPNYMDYQKEIDPAKRSILVSWLVEVSDEYKLESESLFITVSIIDRFLSKMSVNTCNLQLLGVAAMFIATKYEEIYPPNLYQFVDITEDSYPGHKICQMEQEILKTLDFRISLPSTAYFLTQIFAFNKFSKQVYKLAEYLCYLSLMADHPVLEYYPSEIALAAVILAANQLQAESSISPDLKSAYEKSNLDQLNRRNLPKGVKLDDIDRRAFIVDQDLPFCIETLRTLQESAYSGSLSDISIVQKFSSESNFKVSLLQPPKAEDLFLY